MKNILLRDKIIRRSFFKKESLKLALKFLYLNRRLPVQYRWKVLFLLKNLSLKNSPFKIKNRCVQTGRSKSVIRNFRLSRISFRERAVFGQLLGVVKKSW